jgi:hypothetical protein
MSVARGDLWVARSREGEMIERDRESAYRTPRRIAGLCHDRNTTTRQIPKEMSHHVFKRPFSFSLFFVISSSLQEDGEGQARTPRPPYPGQQPSQKNMLLIIMDTPPSPLLQPHHTLHPILHLSLSPPLFRLAHQNKQTP